MDDFLRFAVWLIYVGFIVWAGAAAGRRVSRHYDKPGDGR